MKLDKVRFEKTAFKVPALAAAGHKFPIYPPKKLSLPERNWAKKYCRHKLYGIPG